MRGVTNVAWTDADKEMVAGLWRLGVSASNIAERFEGRTRNSVIGLVHREGFTRPGKAPKPALAKPNPQRRWTEDRTAELTRLFHAGVLDYEIAETLNDKFGINLTRQAVADKRKALDLRADQSAAMARANSVIRLRRMADGQPAALPAAPLPPSEAWKPLPGIEPIPLERLTNTSCKWPVELQGADQHHFCGALKIGPGVYCWAHASISRNSIQPSSKATDLYRQFRRHAA